MKEMDNLESIVKGFMAAVDKVLDKDKDKKVWPQDGDSYHYIYLEYGKYWLTKGICIWESQKFDEAERAGLGIFKPGEIDKGQKEVDKLNAEMRVKAKVHELNDSELDWIHDSKYKFYVIGDLNTGYLGTTCFDENYHYSGHLLKTRELALELIKTHGDDIKIMMGIGE